MGHFYPRPPRGGRRGPVRVGDLSDIISIHALREEGDASREGGFAVFAMISIHALREEGDHIPAAVQRPDENFYPRPPRGGRPSSAPVLLIAVRFLSTPSARRATHRCRFSRGVVGISIHALREEGDVPHDCAAPFVFYFYPRPPRGGRLCAAKMR